MANKTLFLTLSRSSKDIEWGFTFIETSHKRLGNVLVVQNVALSSPACQAGLYPGDIILGIDNSPITGRPLTLAIATELVRRKSTNLIELQVLRDPKNSVKKNKTYLIMSTDSYSPITVNRGIIPSVAQMDSGVRLPDNNVSQFLNEKAREQWAITKQTYRSIPIIEPKPKVRRDWPMGSYLKYMEGPGWHDPPKRIMVQENKLKVLNQLNQTDGQPVYHRQYNSPINLYSESNLNNSINLGSSSGENTSGHSISPQPIYKVNTPKPETIDITHSPTYQFLQEERTAKQRPPITTYSAFNRTSPEPQQTPYLKTLMHSLNVSN